MKNFKLLVLSLFLITSCSTDSVSSPFESDISGSAESGETQGSGNNPNPDPGQITAGEWNDLDNWDFCVIFTVIIRDRVTPIA